MNKEINLQLAKERIRNAEVYVRSTLENRKKAEMLALTWIERLVENDITVDILKQATFYLRPQDYDEVVVERNLANDCGYPLCRAKRLVCKGKYKISLAQKKIYSLERLSQYCSKEHLHCSVYYRSQLSDEPVWARIDSLSESSLPKSWQDKIHLYDYESLHTPCTLENLYIPVKDLCIDDNSTGGVGVTNTESLIQNDETVEGLITEFAQLARQQSQKSQF